MKPRRLNAPESMPPSLEEAVVEQLARMLVDDLRQRNAAELQASAEATDVPPRGNARSQPEPSKIRQRAPERGARDASKKPA